MSYHHRPRTETDLAAAAILVLADLREGADGSDAELLAMARRDVRLADMPEDVSPRLAAAYAAVIAAREPQLATAIACIEVARLFREGK